MICSIHGLIVEFMCPVVLAYVRYLVYNKELGIAMTSLISVVYSLFT
jgi:hypothetical protein